ncbi:hypothetical protein VPHD480_0302 [Vibrio phage D480]
MVEAEKFRLILVVLVNLVVLEILGVLYES